VSKQFDNLKQQPFEAGNDITRYFELLPDTSPIKVQYLAMLTMNEGQQKLSIQNILRNRMQKGAIDVNIMAKVDKMNYNTNGDVLDDASTDALAALRGYAMSSLHSSVVLSAGMNPRLYSYLETFRDFFPGAGGDIRKKVILKVSDFRSALIQAKFLAKKGIWVSEFRIESGLNCGGHAFATDGLLLGPILGEFRQKRKEMLDELWGMYHAALTNKGHHLKTAPGQKISVQGGIGTGQEDDFLRNHFELDATGWGSPFLLVPEATNVDEQTLQKLTTATHDDFYVSDASPLGILFNNFKGSSSEKQRLERVEKGRPGSPCTKKYLCTNTEFTDKPICTASREYQHLKIQQLQQAGLPAEEYQERFNRVTGKICLCEGLCASTYIKNGMIRPRENKAVAICPGPNLSYFSKVYTLDEMVKQIYGHLNLLENVIRPNLFVNELNLYIDYLKKDIEGYLKDVNDKKARYLVKFKDQLQQGINYYKVLIPQITNQTQEYLANMYHDLALAEEKLVSLEIT
ncbi:MAG: hypothetical protein ABIN95_02965, partial [Mucilaginibacter sp.]